MSKSAETIVETSTGKLEGKKQDGLYVFRGIPYASPPVGDRRWLPPEPVEPWRGVRQAKSVGAVAPQNPPQVGILTALNRDLQEAQSEDCLYLNIWSPGLDDARRPVLFWIHGGGFTGGAGSRPIYNGSTLAKQGNTVVVTINYRLGPLGFLNLNEVTKGRIPATGNEGLLDQVAALKWVHDNITAFGGDPSNVTIFGESAGGMSVGSLLALPEARGLFHKAIPQSGAASSVLALDRAARVAEYFLDILGLPANNIDALRSLTVEQILAAHKELPARTFSSDLRITMPLQPVIDGKVLPRAPLDAINNGDADGIPILVGSTLEEWKLLAAADRGLPNLDEAGLVRRCERIIPAKHVKGLIETYRKIRSGRGQPTTPAELFMAIQTDRVFRLPAIRLAEAQRRHYPRVYNYLFTWASPLLGGRLGACHALDIGFIFGTYEPNFFGTGPAADALARNTQDAWLAFAHNGEPSCESLGLWPMYGDSRQTMMLGKECTVEKAPYDEERLAWKQVPNTAIGSI